MKVISSGISFNIYDDSVKMYSELPAAVYKVCFAKGSGFYLEARPDIEISEDKIYGDLVEKVDKVMSSFSVFERSLGTILSGPKGIGKSLFAKILSIKAIERNLPVIIVDSNISGIAEFLQKIDQEVMVLFDEFEKTFSYDDEDSIGPPSRNMGEEGLGPILGLFDGISPGKKLYVITYNDFHSLSGLLVNRPGRFHYHFRFKSPLKEEIVEYLDDKLLPQYKEEIHKVIGLSRKIDLSFDCLRAIAFELNTGLPFEKAIRDLNILRTERSRFELELEFEKGDSLKSDGKIYLDLFDNFDTDMVALYHGSFRDAVAKIHFSASRSYFDPEKSEHDIIDPKDFQLRIMEESDMYDKYIKMKPKRLLLKKSPENTYQFYS